MTHILDGSGEIVQGWLLSTKSKGTSTKPEKWKKRYFITEGAFLRVFNEPGGLECYNINLALVLKIALRQDKRVFMIRANGISHYLQGEHQQITDMWVRHVRRVVEITQELMIKKDSPGYAFQTPLLDEFRDQYCDDVTRAQMIDFLTTGVLATQALQKRSHQTARLKLKESQFDHLQYTSSVPEKENRGQLSKKTDVLLKKDIFGKKNQKLKLIDGPGGPRPPRPSFAPPPIDGTILNTRRGETLSPQAPPRQIIVIRRRVLKKPKRESGDFDDEDAQGELGEFNRLELTADDNFGSQAMEADPDIDPTMTKPTWTQGQGQKQKLAQQAKKTPDGPKGIAVRPPNPNQSNSMKKSSSQPNLLTENPLLSPRTQKTFMPGSLPSNSQGNLIRKGTVATIGYTPERDAIGIATNPNPRGGGMGLLRKGTVPAQSSSPHFQIDHQLVRASSPGPTRKLNGPEGLQRGGPGMRGTNPPPGGRGIITAPRGGGRGAFQIGRPGEEPTRPPSGEQPSDLGDSSDFSDMTSFTMNAFDQQNELESSNGASPPPTPANPNTISLPSSSIPVVTKSGGGVFSLNLFDAAAKVAASKPPPPGVEFKPQVEMLCGAAWENQADKIASILLHPNIKEFVNMPNERGQAALYCAARQGNIEAMIELLNCPHIDVNLQVESHGGTALHAAGFGQCAEGVALLLASGADKKIKNKSGVSGYQEARGGACSDVYIMFQSGGISILKQKYPRISMLRSQQNNSIGDLQLPRPVSIEQIISENPTQPAVVGLMWLLYAKVAIYDELHTSGLVRIDDPDGKIFNWIDSCEGVYERRSTHFPERVEETFILNPGGQRGLDMRSDDPQIVLPANKKTILFFRLADGTTAVKMEKSGCPPFWREGFQTMDNAKEFGNHSMDYFRTRVVENKGMKVSRKEEIPQRFIDAFEAALDIYFPDEAMEEIPGRELSKKQKLFKQGVKYGISEMIKIVEDELLNDTNFVVTINGSGFAERPDPDEASGMKNLIREKIAILYQIVALDRSRGYKGNRRGEEVCMPSPFEWIEVKEHAKQEDWSEDWQEKDQA